MYPMPGESFFDLEKISRIDIITLIYKTLYTRPSGRHAYFAISQAALKLDNYFMSCGEQFVTLLSN